MAIQFPINPSVGQQFTYGDNTWQWSGVTWDIVPGISGVVSSVGISVPTGFVVAGSPVTSTGVMDISFASGYSLPSSASQSNWNTAYNFVNTFPSQTGQSGKFLTTDGSTLSWANGGGTWGSITGTLSNQTDLWNALLGKVDSTTTLTINGVAYDLSANRSWTIDALPSQTGNAGKFLTTDGTVASWATTANIYNSNGTLTGARTVTMATYPLTFSGGTINADRVSIGYLTGDAVLSVQGDSQLWGTANFQSTKGNQISHIHYGTNGNILLRSAATAGVVAMQTAGGNVLIGTETDGTSKLQIRSGSSSTGNALLVQNSTPTDLFTVANTGTSTFSGSITAASAIARGVRITSTLVAAANNDVLVGLDIAPTFTNGAFTGVANWAARIQGRQLISYSDNNYNQGLIIQNTNTLTQAITGLLLQESTNTLVGGFSYYPSNYITTSQRNTVVISSVSTQKVGVQANAAGSGAAQDIWFSNKGGQFNVTLFSTGNLLIQNAGTHTDAGYRLDVNGTTRLQGSSTIQYSDNAFNTGLTIRNTNTGTNALNGITLFDSSNNVAGGLIWVPSNYSVTTLQNSLTIQSGATQKIGIVANGGATGSAQDIYFSTFGTNTTYQMQIKGSTGNVLIGTNTDSGFRLDVSGNTQITGSSSSTGNALTVRNSTPTTLFSVGNNNGIFGAGALAAGTGSIAFGTNATTGGNFYAVALGYDAISSNAHGFAIGYSSRASGNPSFAIGKNAIASGASSTAFSDASASGSYSFAVGNGAIASATGSSTFGPNAYTYLVGQQAITGGNFAYKGDSQFSTVTLALNTGSVASGGTYSFAGIRPSNNTFSAGVWQIWRVRAAIVFSLQNKNTTVTEFALGDTYTVTYDLAVKSNNLTGTTIIGTPVLVNAISDTSMSTTTVAFSVVSNNLVASVTPPTWATGNVLFKATISYQLTEVGVYAQTF